MNGRNQEERRLETGRRRYVRRLEQYFRRHWRAFGVRDVSVIVIGQKGGGLGRPVEFVYFISVHSRHAIPHAGEGHSLTHRNHRFTFVQLGNSVFTNSFTTLATGHYTGSDPPTSPP